MSINIKHSNLLQEETEAIVNTVNCVGVMGKGIALQFKQKWPDNFKAYKKACKDGLVRPGKLFIFEVNPLFGKPRYIVNFPTKDHWQEKSKISYIKDGLKELIYFIKSNNIKSIAIPPLGCGNGGLAWNEVHKLIEEYLAEVRDVSVHLFEPNNNIHASTMEVSGAAPRMTLSRAVIINLISIYNEMSYPLGNIEIQKLCYFAQTAGEDLKLNFVKQQFGPYADNLRHVLQNMNGHYLNGVGDGDKLTPQITLTNNALEIANEFLNSHYLSTVSRINLVSDLINGFETPYGMELLATVHWAAINSTNTKLDLESIIKNIYNWEPSKPAWNARKQSLMQREHIKIALDHLHRLGWV